MYSLTYVSAASSLMKEEELAELLEECRMHNQRLGITGMLLYKDGDFMQVLEGEEETVKQLYARICTDTRHHMATQIIERPIDRRSFGDWTMGFRILHRARLETHEVRLTNVESDLGWGILLWPIYKSYQCSGEVVGPAKEGTAPPQIDTE